MKLQTVATKMINVNFTSLVISSTTVIFSLMISHSVCFVRRLEL